MIKIVAEMRKYLANEKQDWRDELLPSPTWEEEGLEGISDVKVFDPISPLTLQKIRVAFPDLNFLSIERQKDYPEDTFFFTCIPNEMILRKFQDAPGNVIWGGYLTGEEEYRTEGRPLSINSPRNERFAGNVLTLRSKGSTKPMILLLGYFPGSSKSISGLPFEFGFRRFCRKLSSSCK